jgi:hypothetical protein
VRLGRRRSGWLCPGNRVAEQSTAFRALDGHSILPRQPPPYPPVGTLSLHPDGLRWDPALTGWKSWGRRPKRPQPKFIPWADIQAITIKWVWLGRRDLSVRLPDGPNGAERFDVFGNVREKDAIAAFNAAGCNVTRDWRDSSSWRVEVPNAL